MQQQTNILDSQCGKTFWAHSAVTKEKTSGRSSKRSAKSGKKEGYQFLNLKKVNGNPLGASWETVGLSHGDYMMLNGQAYLNGVKESTLSQILEANAPEKYFLSSRVCAGILRRAEKRGKELPAMLKEALEEVIRLNA